MMVPKKKTKSVECETCSSQDRSIFCDLHQLELKKIQQAKTTNHYKKGQILFSQGNHSTGIYCVNQGTIKLSKIGSDGKESIIRLVAEGDVLGHRSLFSLENYAASATVLEDSTICFIDKKSIMQLLTEYPSIAFNLMSRLGRELGIAEERIASITQKNIRERLAELLLLLKESHGIFENGKWKIMLTLTREEMASMIGMATETLIRVLSEFKENKWVEQEGKTLYITDVMKLAEVAQIPY
ncbi:MAG: Crp/Fnr family transcriptional regulator [Bacteriovoracaceae bacterium]|nr:Crp/Fnr family transcriptional regulator [Bacteriovoracaceae bacterium]